jgi:ABC-type phosphate/phosphonate transport system substrate-binding protein
MKYLSRTLMVLAFIICADVSAEEYTLSIQPIMSKDAVVKSYQPLADYLSKHTGQKIKVKAYRNYFTYWQKMKNMEDFDFVLDAAHFTDYRIHKNKYSVLAKLPNTVSYSLVTNDDTLIIDKDELVLKKVATTTSPGLGGIRLYEIFENPTRLPIQVTVNDSSEAVNAVAEGKAVAAIIPTPLVNNYEFLNTVMTTTSIPHMAFSSSPNVPEKVKQDVQSALLKAAYTTDGKKMLKQMKLETFEETNEEEYEGYSRLLKDLFGYSPAEEQISQYRN